MYLFHIMHTQVTSMEHGILVTSIRHNLACFVLFSNHENIGIVSEKSSNEKAKAQLEYL